MKWYDDAGDDLPYTWLCTACTLALIDFEPDMGDYVEWKPGTCERCGTEIIIFTPTA